jgi:large subunit ribosomal protein L3
MLGLIGKKIGMTQVFVGEGELVPVTAIEVGPCTVVQKRLPDRDGYGALQLGFGVRKPKGMSKAERGHCEKKGLPLFRHLREFRTDAVEKFEVGEELLAGAFKEGDELCVTGISKGRGFQGVMKRHGKHGGPASHGSNFHRRPGSIGMRTWPARVPKNTRLPGHMGDERVTLQGLTVVGVRAEDNVILVKGSVPGANGGLLLVVPKDEAFCDRPELKVQKSAGQGAEAAPVEAEKQQAQGEPAAEEQREAPKDEGAKE